jgi:putative addiction module component (TIGR02574 family)
MTRTAKKLLEEALALAPGERADLAASLLESLDETPEEDLEAAWAAEVERRVREVEAGSVKTVPWSEARQRLLKHLHGRAAP